MNKKLLIAAGFFKMPFSIATTPVRTIVAT
jgi:hypothetical protein